MQWSGTILVGVAATVLACCMAGIAVIIRWRRYKKEVAAVQAATYPTIVGYQHLCTTTMHMTLFVGISAIFSGILGILFAIFYTIPSSPSPRISLLVGGAICIFIAPCLVIPPFLYDLLGIVFVDIPALTTFYESELETKEAFVLGLKSGLLGPLSHERRFNAGPPPSLLTFLLLEALGLLCLYNLTYLLWLIPLLGMLWALCRVIFARKILAWSTHTIPIEQSPWASLILHIGEWARVAGVKYQNIRVHTTIRVGNATGALFGILHSTLLLNTVFLMNSEWRQQEASVATLLGLAHKRIPAASTGMGHSLFIFDWLLLTLLTAVFLALPSSRNLTLILFAFLLVCLLTILLLLLRSRWLSRSYETADRFALKLTNDPAALIVALHTTHLLSLPSSTQSSFLDKRIHVISQHILQENQEKIWEYTPVPAISPYSIDAYTLTIPLTEPGISTPLPPNHSKIIDINDYKNS